MTATYVPGSLATSAKDQIRFLLGDTDTVDFQMQDEEIVWSYNVAGSTRGAAAMCADALAAKYARLTQISADGVSQSFQQKSAQFLAIAALLRKQDAVFRAMPFLGGVSIADMNATLSDADRVPDIFRIGMNDDPPSASDGVPFRTSSVADEIGR
jgi:hypothetical protein